MRKVPFLLTALLAVFSALSCRAQIRGADLYAADSHLKPLTAREGSDEAVLRSLSPESRDPLELHDRAVYLARVVRLDESESGFQQLIQAFPDFAPGYVSLSRLYWIAEERGRAKTILGMLASNSKIPDEKILETALALDDAGRSDEAGILLEGLSSNGRMPGETCLTQGKRAYRSGRMGEALVHFRCAAAALPSNRDSRLATGLLHSAAENYRLAAGYLEGIPDDDARFHLARAYAETGRVPQALSVLQSMEKKDLPALELWGSLLLADDLSADVGPVLKMAPPEMQSELLRIWYGTDNPSGREEITRSLQTLR